MEKVSRIICSCVQFSMFLSVYVTNEVFKQLIKLEFPLPSVAKDIAMCHANLQAIH